MPSLILSRRDLDFLLHEWLDVTALTSRERFTEHSRETFDAVLDLAEQIATEKFATHNRKADLAEPHVVDGKVVLIPEVKAALDAFGESGLLTATFDEAVGGMQLPFTVGRAVLAWFQAANTATAAYPFLTLANANLLLAYGTDDQIERFVKPMLDGRWTGTMCLSEPQAGSSLADITTRAEPQDDGSFRLFGNKMWISGGEHELSENIVHLVLAKIPGGPAGVKGISLFVVPRYLDDGSPNDVVLAGLNHKMGYRGTTNTLLNFGEGCHRPGGEAGAVGHLVGGEHRGLALMFHMMNEARIGVGLGATALGYTGYLHALDYARNRPQGRPLGDKNPASPQIPIIEHADVRRMLLAQKAYVEGGMALGLYTAKLVDESETAADDNDRAAAHTLLEVLTPIAKSWPSQWCLAANDLAIQVLGGYGYTRDYPVEQFYRDNRLNPIHEGTHGIQALDLLGRKLALNGGAGLLALETAVRTTVRDSHGVFPEYAGALGAALDRLVVTTQKLHATGDPAVTLANASVHLEAAGHVVVAWLWLQQLVAASGKAGKFYDGKRSAAAFFFRWELPRTGPQFDLLDSLDTTVLDATIN